MAHKYKAAIAALEPVQLAFKDLTRAVGNSAWIKEWEELEEQAAGMWGEAMMIYNVSPIQGIFLLSMVHKHTNDSSTAVSQAGKRGELLSKIPSKEGNEQIQWIWAGMLIELEQYVASTL